MLVTTDELTMHFKLEIKHWQGGGFFLQSVKKPQTWWLSLEILYGVTDQLVSFLS